MTQPVDGYIVPGLRDVVLPEDTRRFRILENTRCLEVVILALKSIERPGADRSVRLYEPVASSEERYMTFAPEDKV